MHVQKTKDDVVFIAKEVVQGVAKYLISLSIMKVHVQVAKGILVVYSVHA